MSVKTINVNKDILGVNEALALNLKKTFENNKTFVINLMAAPGAGKTSTILRLIENLSGKFKMGVIEGDIASDVDSRKIQERNVDVVQINTDGACHLDANMITAACSGLGIEGKDLVIIENVGNLVCPAEFNLGENVKMMILSVPEGHDKPLKYPLMFTESQALLINKVDLTPYTDFNMEEFQKTVRAMNPDIKMFPVSAKTGEGFAPLVDWISERVKSVREIEGTSK
ncbi:MAG: hydrogenase nickel incorporation protein HypB [Deltaproteobacteria bacterium]|nr:hydrogenase nickel incorporation protein HypB [Deltaproteobacteria bacterium]